MSLKFLSMPILTKVVTSVGPRCAHLPKVVTLVVPRPADFATIVISVLPDTLILPILCIPVPATGLFPAKKGASLGFQRPIFQNQVCFGNAVPGMTTFAKRNVRSR